jgi:hypothetical protein
MSKPPEDRPFFKANPIPTPMIAPPKIAQIIGSFVNVVWGIM